jgi:hypothetical protein
MLNQAIVELVESNYEKYKPICELYEWSFNFDDVSPFMLFLDIIGYSQEQGEYLTNGLDWQAHLKFREIGLLADALQMFANKPEKVETFINDLLNAESQRDL